MHAYQRQDAPLSLRDGIAEYFASHPFLKRGAELSPEGQRFFRCHDTVHVLWGCDTSLAQEAVVKLASIFGTTAGFAVLRGYRLHDAADIYRALTIRDILATIAVAFLIVPRTIWRCRRQAKRWPWSDFDPLLDTPLGQLRAAFGIRVAGPRH
jgi:hypothetical protein